MRSAVICGMCVAVMVVLCVCVFVCDAIRAAVVMLRRQKPRRRGQRAGPECRGMMKEEGEDGNRQIAHDLRYARMKSMPSSRSFIDCDAGQAAL